MGEHDGVAGGEDAVCGGAATARTTAQGSGATGRLAARWLRGFCEPSLRVALKAVARPIGVEFVAFHKVCINQSEYVNSSWIRPARKIFVKFAKYCLHVTSDMCYTSLSSMKTCLNISATSWPTMTVAKATRHSRYTRGYVFSLGLSLASIGKQPEGNMDRHGAGR